MKKNGRTRKPWSSRERKKKWTRVLQKCVATRRATMSKRRLQRYANENFDKLVCRSGSRSRVAHMTAEKYKRSTIHNVRLNKRGFYVSVKKSKAAKRRYKEHILSVFNEKLREFRDENHRDPNADDITELLASEDIFKFLRNQGKLSHDWTPDNGCNQFNNISCKNDDNHPRHRFREKQIARSRRAYDDKRDNYAPETPDRFRRGSDVSNLSDVTEYQDDDGDDGAGDDGSGADGSGDDGSGDDGAGDDGAGDDGSGAADGSGDDEAPAPKGSAVPKGSVHGRTLPAFLAAAARRGRRTFHIAFGDEVADDVRTMANDMKLMEEGERDVELAELARRIREDRFCLTTDMDLAAIKARFDWKGRSQQPKLNPHSIFIVAKEGKVQKGIAVLHMIQLPQTEEATGRPKRGASKAFVFNPTGLALDLLCAHQSGKDLVDKIQQTGEAYFGDDFVGTFTESIGSAMPFYAKVGFEGISTTELQSLQGTKGNHLDTDRYNMRRRP